MSYCADCIHCKSCEYDDYDGYFNKSDFGDNCRFFTDKKTVTVSLDWDTYEDIIETIKKTREHTYKIRKSQNRENALFALDRVEYLIKGVSRPEVN